MSILDVFKSRPFHMVKMTEQINKRPFAPNYLQALGITQVVPSATTVIAVEKKEGTLNLVGTSARGAPRENRTGVKRDMRYFETYRLGLESTIYASELQNIRADGSENTLKQLRSEVTERTDMLEIDMNATEEHMLLGMVQGIVVDANGQELHHAYDDWQIAPATEINWDLPNASLEQLQDTALKMKRSMARSQRGFQWSGAITGLCGDEYFDKLIANAELNKTYLNQSEAAALRGDVRPFGMVSRFGINFVNYRGTDDNTTIKIPDDKVKFFPSDRGSRMFMEVRGPSESFAGVNKKGKRRFARMVVDKERDEWARVELDTYPTYICRNPEMLRSGRMA